MNFDKKDKLITRPDEDTNINQILNEFKDKVNLLPNTRIKVIDKNAEIDGSQTISISYTGEYPVKPPESNQEILVSTPLIAKLHLDKTKELVDYKVQDPDPSTIDALKTQLGSMLKTGEIGNEFYLQKDNQGKQHLKRDLIY